MLFAHQELLMIYNIRNPARLHHRPDEWKTAELGVIASVIQIADTRLRLSIKLCTFGGIVAGADKSVSLMSKDVSLTSLVLKSLGEIMNSDGETRKLTPTAVKTTDNIVKECLKVFQEMKNIIVKKLPNLRPPDSETASNFGEA